MKLEEAHKQLIHAFSRHQVRFIVIGGHAAIYYGSERTTSDIDILVYPDVDNGKRILAAFSDLKLECEDLSPEDFTNQLVLSFGYRPEEVDIINYIIGVDLDAAFERKIEAELDGVTVPVIDIRDLLQNKLSLKRDDLKGLMDQQDILSLRKKLDNQAGSR